MHGCSERYVQTFHKDLMGCIDNLQTAQEWQGSIFGIHENACTDVVRRQKQRVALDVCSGSNLLSLVAPSRMTSTLGAEPFTNSRSCLKRVGQGASGPTPQGERAEAQSLRCSLGSRNRRCQ